MYSTRSIDCAATTVPNNGPSQGDRNATPHEAAGSDADLREEYTLSQVRERRLRAEQLMADAEGLLETERGAAEALARDALHFFARSLDWAEDTDQEEEAHGRMDTAGSWVRETFGCHLARTGTSYQQTCPVALGHNRIGMRVGGVARRTCSLCGLDFSECAHLPGTAYLVPGGASDLGWCRVCLKAECDHNPADSYRVAVVARITEMRVDEVSLVSKPAHPEARLSAISVPVSDLIEALGDDFVPGTDVSCDRCLLACDGLIRHDMPHG